VSILKDRGRSANDRRPNKHLQRLYIRHRTVYSRGIGDVARNKEQDRFVAMSMGAIEECHPSIFDVRAVIIVMTVVCCTTCHPMDPSAKSANRRYGGGGRREDEDLPTNNLFASRFTA